MIHHRDRHGCGCVDGEEELRYPPGGGVKDMTLVVALEGRDGLVLAADSRGTIGDPRSLTAINDSQTKLFRLSDWCGVGVSGASELAATLVDGLRTALSGDTAVCADRIAELTQKHVKQTYASWFGNRTWVSPQAVQDQRPVIVFTLAGYRLDGSGQPVEPRIWLLSSQLDFAPQLCPSGYMLAGIPQYAIYLLHRMFNRKMAVTQLSALAAYLITETATQDPKVGGPVRIAQITKERPYQELDAQAVETMIKRNDARNARLRSFFSEDPEGH